MVGAPPIRLSEMLILLMLANTSSMNEGGRGMQDKLEQELA